jgi:putative transposase
MKRSKFTEQQIAFALKQAELGTTVDEVCRKLGISDATFYNWKKKYGGLGPSELRRLRQLEEENTKLKKLVADLSLDKIMLVARGVKMSQFARSKSEPLFRKVGSFARDPSAIQGRVDGNSRAQGPGVIRTANRPNPGDFEEHCRPLFGGR